MSKPYRRRRGSQLESTPQRMNAVFIQRAGGPTALSLQEVECPQVNDDEVLIEVVGAAVSRIDLDNRRKGLKKSDGTLYCPGIACSGYVKTCGRNVHGWKQGEKVCAVLNGGGYAEKVAVPCNQLLRAPPNCSLRDAASLTFTACTTLRAMLLVKLEGKRILIHESCGDVATLAIQIAKKRKAYVFVVAESGEKLDFYRRLGADMCFNSKDVDFSAKLNQTTEGNDKKGVRFILDSCPINLPKNLKALSRGGTIVYVDLHGGSLAEMDIPWLMAKHARVVVLQNAKNLDERVLRRVERDVWPLVAEGSVRPMICRIFFLSEIVDAHLFMEGNNSIKKLVSLIPWATWTEPYIYSASVSKNIMGSIVLQVSSSWLSSCK